MHNCEKCGKPLRGYGLRMTDEKDCNCNMVTTVNQSKKDTDRIFGYFILTAISIILIVMLAVQSAKNNKLQEVAHRADSCYRINLTRLDSVVHVQQNRDSIFMANFFKAAEAWEKRGRKRQMPPTPQDTVNN